MNTRNLARFLCIDDAVTTKVDDILDTTLANVYVKDKKDSIWTVTITCPLLLKCK
ncbi:LuxR family transcriptional regulator [Legionella sainthelensi]|nr:LuxR family transcriptional regulator [Legionella sainthelensi]